MHPLALSTRTFVPYGDRIENPASNCSEDTSYSGEREGGLAEKPGNSGEREKELVLDAIYSRLLCARGLCPKPEQ